MVRREREMPVNFTVARPRTAASAAGVGRAMRGGSVLTRIRPAPKAVSGPGAPRSSAIAPSWARSPSAFWTSPVRRWAARSTAAAPAAFGAALEVPPTARGPLGPITRVFVGAVRSGLRRPSAVGPWAE